MSWSKKLKKVNFWRRNYSPAMVQLPLKSRTSDVDSTIKNKGSKIKKCELFILQKRVWKEWNVSYAKMFKGGNKHARIISNTCSKLSIRTQNQHSIFWLQPSTFSLWATFNSSRGVLIANFQQIYSFGSFVFSIHHFYVQNIINGSEH